MEIMSRPSTALEEPTIVLEMVARMEAFVTFIFTYSELQPFLTSRKKFSTEKSPMNPLKILRCDYCKFYQATLQLKLDI
jgi:hypothetical protein